MPGTPERLKRPVPGEVGQLLMKRALHLIAEQPQWVISPTAEGTP